MEVQAVSAALASEFNRQAAAARVEAKQVSFTMVTLATIQGGHSSTGAHTVNPRTLLTTPSASVAGRLHPTVDVRALARYPAGFLRHCSNR